MKKQILFSFFLLVPAYSYTYEAPRDIIYNDARVLLDERAVLLEGAVKAGLSLLTYYLGKKFIDYTLDSVKNFSTSNNNDNQNDNQEETIINISKKVSWYGPLPDAAQRIMQFAQNFEKLKAAGLDKSPNVLLEGPPGTGKSHLARYIAQELGVAYFEKNSGEFHDKYIGVGPQAMKQLFADAAACAQNSNSKSIGAVIFIDEIEGIGSKRDGNGGETGAEETRLLNTLFSEMTKKENERVLVICATNLAHKLDDALIRPGRFGLHAHIGCPEFANRVELFKNFLNNAYKSGQEFKNNETFTGKTPYSQTLFEKAAELTENFVTADIKEVVERALLNAVEKEGKDIASESLLIAAINELRQQKDTIANARVAHDPFAKFNTALTQAA